jgi:hypothetical protein
VAPVNVIALVSGLHNIPLYGKMLCPHISLEIKEDTGNPSRMARSYSSSSSWASFIFCLIINLELKHGLSTTGQFEQLLLKHEDMLNFSLVIHYLGG